MLLNPNCWNEYGELNTVIVCSPSSLDIPNIQIAKNVRWLKPTTNKKAQENFEVLVHTLQENKVKVIDYSEYLHGEEANFHEQLLNRYFVRDLACVLGNTVIPGEAGTSMRRPEFHSAHQVFKEWFPPEKFSNQWNNDMNAFEAGDIFILGRDVVFINIGIRTSYESVQALKKHLFQIGFTEIGIIDLPRRKDTLHLDLNCNVAGPDLVIAKSFMRYFPVQILSKNGHTYMMMDEFLKRHGYEVCWTNKVKHTVADINFIHLDPDTLLISSKAHKRILTHPKLKKKRLVEVDVSELEKGEGGIRCMTLPIERKK